MNPKKLVSDDGATVVWACGKCGRAHKAKQAAAECCLCYGCHKSEPFLRFGLCEPCGKNRGEALRSQRLDKLRISAQRAEVKCSHGGHVFDPEDAGQLCDVADAIERMNEGDGFARGFAFCSTGIVLRLDVDELVEGELERLEIGLDVETPGLDDLKSAVERFNALQTAQWWAEDTTRIVVLDRERFDAFLNGCER